MQKRTFSLLALLFLVVMAGLWGWAGAPPAALSEPPPPPPTAPLPPAPAPPEVLYFPETGHYVGYAFLRFFRERGGLDIFGYPRTEEMAEEGRTVQYFQRARFEYWPEYTGTPYEVQLTLLGDLLARGRAFPKAEPFPDSGDHRYFPETGHGVHFAFLRFFRERGVVDVFGYPISEELYGEGGWPYAVQYFQRARFEYHLENAGTLYEVQLGLQGDEYLMQRGWLPRPGAPPPPTPTPAPPARPVPTATPTPRPIPTPDPNKPPQTGTLTVRWRPGELLHWGLGASYFDTGPFENLAFTQPYVGKTLVVRVDNWECEKGVQYCGWGSNELYRSFVGEVQPLRMYDPRTAGERLISVRERETLTWRIQYGQYFLFFSHFFNIFDRSPYNLPAVMTYTLTIRD